MKGALKVILPVLVVVAAAAAAGAMYLSRPEPETRPPEEVVPLIRVQTVTLTDRQLKVSSQGTVSPRTESSLVPEVAGRVLSVSPEFAAGGFFEAGEVLLTLDPHDYRQAVVRARARVAQAELRLAQEQAEAEVAAEEWQALGGGEEPSPLTLRRPQVNEARAALEAARADLEQSERDLERTAIRAPFAGRVRRKSVDVGQYVTPGTPLATLYAVDAAEVRLPLPDRELAFVDLPLAYRDAAATGPRPKVILRAEFAGRTFEWEGRIVRTEGEIDPVSRMVTAVARVDDPYARGEDPQRPPLAAGLYVNAEIMGHRVKDVAVVPRAALRGDDRVLVVDGDSRLRFRPVEVLRRTQEEVIIGGGLAEGERICLSPLVTVTDGMKVRTEDGG